MNFWVLPALLGLAACGSSSPDLRWIGPLTATANPALCPPTKGVVLLREGRVTFTPDQGTWVLTGIANPDGTMQADRDRLTSSRRNGVYETHLDAKWTEAQVNGTYTTPRCTYTVALTRQ